MNARRAKKRISKQNKHIKNELRQNLSKSVSELQKVEMYFLDSHMTQFYANEVFCFALLPSNQITVVTNKNNRTNNSILRSPSSPQKSLMPQAIKLYI